MLTEPEVEKQEFVRQDLINGNRADLINTIRVFNKGGMEDHSLRKSMDRLHLELLGLHAVFGLTLLEEENGSFLIGGSSEGNLVSLAKTIDENGAYLSEYYSGNIDGQVLSEFQARRLINTFYPPLKRINDAVESNSSKS